MLLRSELPEEFLGLSDYLGLSDDYLLWLDSYGLIGSGMTFPN